jgi:hypothetical protein
MKETQKWITASNSLNLTGLEMVCIANSQSGKSHNSWDNDGKMKKALAQQWGKK